MSKIRRMFPLLMAFICGMLFNILWNLTLNLHKSTIYPLQLLLSENNPANHPYRTNLLPASDYNTLVNVKDFEFNIMNYPCGDNKLVLLLILVPSAPGHEANREAIRTTWGQKVPEIELLFLLGGVDSDEVQKRLHKENQQYNDIIQGSFKDTYRNLTYKHVMALKYAAYHCPQAKYILKVDDDVFVNTPKVINFIQNHLIPINADNFLFCSVRDHEKVLRADSGIKWAVSLEEYPGKEYPTYCEGWAVVYSPDAAFNLYRNAQAAPYFWIDDVHVTGTMAVSTNITHVSSKDQTLNRNRMKDIINMGNKRNVLDYFLFGPMQMSIPDIKDLWNILYEPYIY